MRLTKLLLTLLAALVLAACGEARPQGALVGEARPQGALVGEARPVAARP